MKDLGCEITCKVGKLLISYQELLWRILYKSLMVWMKQKRGLARGFLQGRGMSLKLEDLHHISLISSPIYFMSLLHHPDNWEQRGKGGCQESKLFD